MPDGSHISRALDHSIPHPKGELNSSSPLELLVATILSAQCTDQRVNRVTDTLFKKYRAPRDYAEAVPAILEQEIRPTGFYKNKARYIIGCCREIIDRFSGHVPQTMDDLVTLPGVWRKTASVLLGNCFGKPVIVVDTHVLRVSRRLGLSKSDDPDMVELDLAGIFAPDQWVRVSLQLVLHGRYTCKAKAPLCESCSLKSFCSFYNDQ